MKTLRFILHVALTTATVILLCFHYSSAQNSFPTPTGACELDATGVGANSGGELRLLELNANGANFVGLKAPDNIGANVVWIWPDADGGNGNVLSTNGSGTLNFVKRVNTDLSNLKPATAINSSLVPGISNSIDLGSPTFAWRNGYFLGTVGIGTTTPDNTLHVFKASAGVVTGNINSPLVVENSANCFVNVLAPDASERGILFGDNLANNDGGIIYNGAANANGLQFRTNGNVNRMAITSDGDVGIETNTPTTKLQILGGDDASLALNGFLQLGASTASNVIFDDNEIMARNNGAVSTLFLQNSGGDFNVSGGGLFLSNTDESVGINTITPDNTLHVFKGSAGAVTGNINAPLVVENSVNCFINLLAPDGNERGILFGDNLAAADGGIIYNATASLNGLDFRTNGNISRMTLSNTGSLSVDAAVIIGPTNGVINCGGALSSTVNVIGDDAVGLSDVNGDEDLYIDDDLQVNGSAFKPGGGSWTASSDSRLKKDVRPYQDGLEQLLKIKPVWYKYNELMHLKDNKEYVGVIAQEMKEVVPYTVESIAMFQKKHEDAEGNDIIDDPGTNYFTFDPSALTYMLINSVKEQNQQIIEKDSRINGLQQQLDDQQVQVKKLTDQLTALEAVVSKPGSTDGTARFEMSTENAQPVLGQNIPNPFDNTTLIPFRLPKNCKDASLRIIETTTGSILRVIPLVCGETQISIDAGQLASGNYSYSLYVDGNLVGTKQMTLTK